MILAVHFQSCTYKECPNKVKQHPAKLMFNYYRLGDRLTGEQVCGKGFGDLGGLRVEFGPAVCSNSEKANGILGGAGRTLALRRLREVMITLELAFVRPHLENGIQFCPVQERNG